MSEELNVPVKASNSLSEDSNWRDGESGGTRGTRKRAPGIGYSSQDGLVRIVITNDVSNESARGALGHFETDMRKLANAVSQATNTDTYFSSKTKSINPATGKAFYEMYIQQTELANAEQALKYQLGKMSGSGGANYEYAYEQVKYATTYLNLHGKQAQARAKAEIADVAGGKILPAPTGKSPERFKALIPLPDDLSEKDKAWLNKRKKAIFQESIALSNVEKNRRKKEEEELETERQLALIQKEFKEVQKARLENARTMQKLEEEELKEKASVEKQVAKYFEDEEDKRIKEEKRKEKEAKKQENEEAKVEVRWKKRQKSEIEKLMKENQEDFPLVNKEAFLAGNEPVAEAKSDEELLDLLREADEYNKPLKEADRKASKEMEAEKKEIAESVRRTTAVLKVISSVAVVAVDILRRILTATINNARETERQGVQARNLGMTTEQVRESNLFDISRGLPKGTEMRAIQALQGKFGDVTNLDTKSLEILARVMGSGVSEMVRSGMGGSNPDVLLEHILDKYFEQFKSGKNSLGQQVGQQQARRELTTVLAQVSPELAQLFSKMADDYSSGLYKFSNRKEYKDIINLNRTNLYGSDIGLNEEVTKKINEIIAIVDDLKTSFFTRLANSMDDIITKIRGIQIGMTDENKLESDRKAREANRKTEERLKNQIEVYDMTAQKNLDDIAKGIPTIPTNVKGGKTYHYKTSILAGIATGDIDEKYIKDHWKEFEGMGMKSSKEAKKYIERAQEILPDIIFGESADELARIIGIKSVLYKLEKEDKDVGEGVQEITYSANRETAEARTLIENIGKKLLEEKQGIYGSKYEVFLPNADKLVKRAYAQELRDNPQLYQDTFNALFSWERDEGNYESEVVGTAVSVGKMKPAYLLGRYKEMLETARKEKGSDLTEAEKKDIAIDLMTDVNTAYHYKGVTKDPALAKKIDKYVGAEMERQAGYTETADSTVMNQLMFKGFTLEKGKSYNVQGQFNNGVYSVDINITDAKGEKSTQRIELGTMDYGNFSQTIDSNGNLVSNSTNM